MVNDLGVGHCKWIILTLAEASVLPGWTFWMWVLVLVHFILAEGFDWAISSALVIEENKLVQDHEQNLVFDWAETAWAAGKAFLWWLETLSTHQVLAWDALFGWNWRLKARNTFDRLIQMVSNIIICVERSFQFWLSRLVHFNLSSLLWGFLLRAGTRCWESSSGSGGHVSWVDLRVWWNSLNHFRVSWVENNHSVSLLARELPLLSTSWWLRLGNGTWVGFYLWYFWPDWAKLSFLSLNIFNFSRDLTDGPIKVLAASLLANLWRSYHLWGVRRLAFVSLWLNRWLWYTLWSLCLVSLDDFWFEFLAKFDDCELVHLVLGVFQFIHDLLIWNFEVESLNEG